ncbi:MAG TPA: protein kinase [Chloroflexota bacterium]
MQTTHDTTAGQSLHPLIGRVLGNRYQLQRVAGTGATSTVFMASDLRLERTVAIKVLHPQLSDDASLVARFDREARVAAGLTVHPHVVAVYDVGQEGDLHYIVSEYVDGTDLKELIHRDAPLRLEHALAVGQSVAVALQFFHDQRLVHRDIKPQNLLVGESGTVKVADFGIALPLNATQITTEGTVLGTAAYLSPEQARGDVVGPPSDLYSLGVVLYEMLTGQVPFRAETALGVAMQHVQQPPLPPGRINAALSPAVDALVLRALRKDPAERYTSAAEFRAAMSSVGLKPVSVRRFPAGWRIALPVIVLCGSALAGLIAVHHGSARTRPTVTPAQTRSASQHSTAAPLATAVTQRRVQPSPARRQHGSPALLRPVQITTPGPPVTAPVLPPESSKGNGRFKHAHGDKHAGDQGNGKQDGNGS